MSEQLDQRRIRRQKLEDLQQQGRDPFAHHKHVATHTASELIEGFDELDGQRVSAHGRLMAYRGHGKSAFADLHDQSGRL